MKKGSNGVAGLENATRLQLSASSKCHVVRNVATLKGASEGGDKLGHVSRFPAGVQSEDKHSSGGATAATRQQGTHSPSPRSFPNSKDRVSCLSSVSTSLISDRTKARYSTPALLCLFCPTAGVLHRMRQHQRPSLSTVYPHVSFHRSSALRRCA